MRRAWRVMAAAGCLLAGVAIFLSVLLYARIQHDREANIRNNCLATNERHDAAIRQLDRLIAKIPPGPRRERAKTGRASTVLLLEAIVPHKKCETVVDRQLHPS